MRQKSKLIQDLPKRKSRPRSARPMKAAGEKSPDEVVRLDRSARVRRKETSGDARLAIPISGGASGYIRRRSGASTEGGGAKVTTAAASFGASVVPDLGDRTLCPVHPVEVAIVETTGRAGARVPCQ